MQSPKDPEVNLEDTHFPASESDLEEPDFSCSPCLCSIRKGMKKLFDSMVGGDLRRSGASDPCRGPAVEMGALPGERREANPGCGGVRAATHGVPAPHDGRPGVEVVESR